MKEAGYKETRIFTPETERSRSGDGENNENRLSVRDGMEAVVGFFAGLLPTAMSSRTSLAPPPESGNNGPTTSQDFSPSPSSLINHASQRQTVGASYDLAEPHTPSTLSSSIESLGEPISRLNRPYDSRINSSASTVNLHAPRTYHSQRPSLPHRNTTPFSHSSQQMQKQSSRSSLHLQAIQHRSNIASSRPSRPSAYVRHMTSTSSMPPRPNSTPPHMNRPVIFVTDNDHDSSSTQPPLPPSWLESVTRAVLFGGTGAYIGGPSSFISHESAPLTGPSSPSSAKPHVLRSTRSSLSQVSSRRSKYYTRQPMNRRSGLSDQTNSPIASSGSRSSFFVPPPLFSQIERGRSRRSEGEVSRTRVVCRSAPGSRNGSLTRTGGGGGGGIDDGKERWRKRENTRKKEGKGRLPSLARTQAEGDVWDQRMKTRGNNGGSNNASRYLSTWGADAHSEAGSSSASSEEEEDGELDLARILVPPKRQNSIKSLRKHLASEAGLGHGAHATLKNYAASAGPTDRRAGRDIRGDGGGSGHRVPTTTRMLQRRKTDEDWDGESQEEWGGGWVRRKGAGNRESEDDSFVGFGFFGEDRTTRTTSLVGTSKKKNNESGTATNRLGFRGF